MVVSSIFDKKQIYLSIDVIRNQYATIYPYRHRIKERFSIIQCKIDPNIV